MNKKKIILISMAVTLALVLSVGGLASVLADSLHPMPGKYRLLGVGWCARYDYEQPEVWKSTQTLDTMFIITNPNCDRNIKLEWMFIIDEDENIEYDGPVEEGYEELSPHQVWEFYLSEYIDVEEYDFLWQPPEHVPKYTVEIMWSGVYYSWGLGWSDSPCTGWMKQFITTESAQWDEDACLCVDDTDGPCECYLPSQKCTGGCRRQPTIPGADCSQCDCACKCIDCIIEDNCMVKPGHCDCSPSVCGGWVSTLPVTEVSESEMMVYQPARVR